MILNGVEYEVRPARLESCGWVRDDRRNLRLVLEDDLGEKYVSPTLTRENFAHALRPWTSDDDLTATMLLSEFCLGIAEVFGGTPTRGQSFFSLHHKGRWAGLLSSDRCRYFLSDVLASFLREGEQERLANEAT